MTTRPAPKVIHYETTNKTSRLDRILDYMKTFEISDVDMLELERYKATVTKDKCFTIAQRSAFSERCGLDLSDLLRICEDVGDITIICLLCKPGSELGRLKYSPDDSHHDHLPNFHDIDATTSPGRCHYPRCHIVRLLLKIQNKQVEKKRIENLLTRSRPAFLFPKAI